jgi:hypothetical protein
LASYSNSDFSMMFRVSMPPPPIEYPPVLARSENLIPNASSKNVDGAKKCNAPSILSISTPEFGCGEQPRTAGSSRASRASTPEFGCVEQPRTTGSPRASRASGKHKSFPLGFTPIRGPGQAPLASRSIKRAERPDNLSRTPSHRGDRPSNMRSPSAGSKWLPVPTTSEPYLQLLQQPPISIYKRRKTRRAGGAPSVPVLKNSDSPPVLFMRSPPELSRPATLSSSGLGTRALTSTGVDESSRPMSIMSLPGMDSPEGGSGHGDHEESLLGSVCPVHRPPK